MKKEIERKFLSALPFTQYPWIFPEGKKLFIGQAYLVNKGNMMQRIRRTQFENKPSYEFTIKKYLTDVERGEVNIPIDSVLFNQIYPLCKRAVYKDRFSFDYNGMKIDVDLFDKGPCIVEIEFSNDDPFVKPHFCGKEVTGDEGYSNLYFAKNI